MTYPRLLPDDHLQQFIQQLTPPDLAQTVVLMNDLAFALTHDQAAADHILCCVGSQINDRLSEDDAARFRSVLNEFFESDPRLRRR